MLTRSDRRMIGHVQLFLGGVSEMVARSRGTKVDRQVAFQFPPKITSDNKSGDWIERDVAKEEPFVIFKGGKARDITMKWVYIVGAVDSTWTVSKVAGEVKRVRQYFFSSLGNDVVIRFNAYDVVGPGNGQTYSFRSDGVSISHGETIVGHSTDKHTLIEDGKQRNRRSGDRLANAEARLDDLTNAEISKINKLYVPKIIELNKAISDPEDEDEAGERRTKLAQLRKTQQLMEAARRAAQDKNARLKAELGRDVPVSLSAYRAPDGYDASVAYYPLKTEISISLKLWTNLDGEADFGDASGTEQKASVIVSTRLEPIPRADREGIHWF